MQKLPMLATLACHLLTAWTLKLPLWPIDLQEAVREGELPFRDAVTLSNNIVANHPVAQHALRAFGTSGTGGLLALVQRVASNMNVVVPELNLGAAHALFHAARQQKLKLLCQLHGNMLGHDHHTCTELTGVQVLLCIATAPALVCQERLPCLLLI